MVSSPRRSAVAILSLPRWRGTKGMTWYGGFQAPIAGPRRTQSRPAYSAAAIRVASALTDTEAATRKGTKASGSIRKEAASSGKSLAGCGSSGIDGRESVGVNFHSSVAVSNRDTVTSAGGTRSSGRMSAGTEPTSGRMYPQASELPSGETDIRNGRSHFEGYFSVAPVARSRRAPL